MSGFMTWDKRVINCLQLNEIAASHAEDDVGVNETGVPTGVVTAPPDLSPVTELSEQVR